MDQHRPHSLRAAVTRRQRSQDRLRAVTASVGVGGVVTAGAVAFILPGATHTAAASTQTARAAQPTAAASSPAATGGSTAASTRHARRHRHHHRRPGGAAAGSAGAAAASSAPAASSARPTLSQRSRYSSSGKGMLSHCRRCLGSNGTRVKGGRASEFAIYNLPDCVEISLICPMDP